MQKAVPFVLLFAASMATNTNFLISVAALTGSASVVKAAWRVGLLFDFVTTVAIIFCICL